MGETLKKLQFFMVTVEAHVALINYGHLSLKQNFTYYLCQNTRHGIYQMYLKTPKNHQKCVYY